MKKKETISRVKRKLFKIAKDSNDPDIRRQAWCMATALQWATEEVDWSLLKVLPCVLYNGVK